MVGLEAGFVGILTKLGALGTRFRNLTGPLVLNATTAFDDHLNDLSTSGARGNEDEKDLLHADLFILNSLAQLTFQLSAVVDLGRTNRGFTKLRAEPETT